MRLEMICVFTFIFSFSNCGGQSFEERKHQGYIESKQHFDTKFIDQFPLKIESDTSFRTAKLAPERNKVGFSLYEFDMNLEMIDSIKNNVAKRVIAVYNSSDTCLLIVPYEVIYKNDNGYQTVFSDSGINKDCYQGKLPIANFFDDPPEKHSIIGLDTTFLIYVLEAKSGNHFKKFEMKPSPLMPDNWKNGYSKGVAISEKRKMVVYWSIMW